MYIERHLLVSLAEVVVLVLPVLELVSPLLVWVYFLSKLYKSSQHDHELYETARRGRLSGFCRNRSFYMACHFLKITTIKSISIALYHIGYMFLTMIACVLAMNPITSLGILKISLKLNVTYLVKFYTSNQVQDPFLHFDFHFLLEFYGLSFHCLIIYQSHF